MKNIEPYHAVVTARNQYGHKRPREVGTRTAGSYCFLYVPLRQEQHLLWSRILIAKRFVERNDLDDQQLHNKRHQGSISVYCTRVASFHVYYPVNSCIVSHARRNLIPCHSRASGYVTRYKRQSQKSFNKTGPYSAANIRK
jgi:hypothetical protein